MDKSLKKYLHTYIYIYLYVYNYIYMELSCCIFEIQHCKLTILQLKKKKNPTTFEPINVRLNRHEKQKLCNNNWHGFVVNFASI